MLRNILNALYKKGWKVFERPYELNIVGIRSTDTRSNRFDDLITVFYRNGDAKWVFHPFPATTDPGTYWLNNPAMAQGTAILAEGQYMDAYKIDKHRGKYYALCQRLGKVTVIRDYDRNTTLDFGGGRREEGNFGINIHRARAMGSTVEVERHSAGCQVFADASHFNLFMQLCERHKSLYGNVFTYSLIDFRALERAGLANWVMGTLTLASGFAAAFLTVKFVNNPKQLKQ